MKCAIRGLLAALGSTAAITAVGLAGAQAAHATHSAGALHVTRVGHQPNAIAVDARINRAFVVNSGDNTVSVINSANGLVVRTMRLSNTPVGFNNSGYTAAADDTTGRVFVVMQGHPPAPSSVSILDAATGRLLRTTRVGVFASAVAVDKLTNRVFMANLDSNTVSVLDARNGATLRTVPVGRGPSSIAVAEQAGRAFAVNSDGTLSVLDARTGAVVRSITTGQQAAGFVLSALGRVFAFGQSGRVTVLDAVTLRTVRTVVLPPYPGAAAADPATGRVFVTDTGSNGTGRTVTILNARTGARARTVSVGRGPLDVRVDVGAARVFVANYVGNSVSVLDAATGAVVRTIASPNPFVMAVDTPMHRVFVVNFSVPHRAGTVTILDARA